MKFIRELENSCFKIIYFLINIIIFIGESIQRIFCFIGQFIINLILNLFRFILYFVKKSKSLLSSIKLPRIKIRKLLHWPRFISLKFQFFSLGVCLTLLIVIIYQGYIFVKNLPSPTNIGKVNYSLTSHIFDRNGNLLYEIYF